MVNGKLIFVAEDGTTNNRQIWTSDGTTANTVALTTGPHSFVDMLATPTLAFFLAGSGATSGLYSTDGASAPVQINVPGAPSGFSPQNLTIVGSNLFFSSDDGPHGRELWVSGGTTATTVMLDLNPGGGSSNPENMIAVGNQLFFSADDGIHGEELWVSNGTAAGTHMVLDILSGSASSVQAIFRPPVRTSYSTPMTACMAANTGSAMAPPAGPIC